MSERGIPVTTVDELEAIVGTPLPRVAEKTRDRLHEVDREFLAAAPLAFVATSDDAGRLDVSPKGDPAGFALVLDDTTIVLPERPGNRRVDGFRNILRNPHVGLLFVVPGRGDTLRINGRATIVRDAPFLDDLVVRRHRPELALVVDVEEVFFHCSKAFLRSRTWEPETWHPEAVRRRALIAKAIEQPAAALEELDEYYGPSYAERIYG
ncbi:MSMEG_1061 family FMN-dependent PPOX-type flavoprotein [Agromyces sp. C10]|jgi:PPOX class probable FMN-dependent enzyme|uniref:MSMEG_1061 family FMN-dependent PPOX-type flavoprotein n=1 Tax=Agromyces sp. C10 TaxID=2935077 RepID=UPI00200B4028|nr:MSMEG_1061 family FMN-dependent PPOX-type flavoprotein [Agromyces sp. C10]MCK8609684.1 pyridoxamine 5'-phosphate oxidase family protein [Agromyces sp. C10]